MRIQRISKKAVLFAVLTICLFLTAFLGSAKQTDAATGYVLKVNRKRNVVTAYKDNVPVRVMLCSTGRNNATPLGTYNTSQKIRWHELDGPVYGQYCTRITGHYLFHSVYYYEMGNKNDLAISQYRKLGKQASHGCVRLSVEDAKWIYDNCSLGTKVIIYEDDKTGPLGKPKNVQIPSNYTSKWDPTDPDPANPYYQNRPTIKISSKKAKTVTLGKTYDLTKGVTAKDYKGKSITSRIKVSGRVTVTKPGKYYLKFWVQDKKGNYAYKHFTVTVKKSSKPVIMGLSSKKTLKINNNSAAFKYKEDVKAYDRDGTSLTKKIKVTFSSKYKNAVKISGEKLRFYKPGTYKIKYSVTGLKANGKKKRTKTLTVTVKDNTKPTITNTIASETIVEGTEYGKKQILNGISAATKFTAIDVSKVTYKINGQNVESIDTTVPGTYTITYSVKSASGKSAATVSRTVVVEPKPVEEPVVPETPEDTTPTPEPEVPENTTPETDTSTEAGTETTQTV